MRIMLGVMLDCSRNAVMKKETIRDFAAMIARMGYDTLMLYTEDTYEVDGQPCFGHMRGRYTKEELREIDAACAGLGIELIPCIQTLGHLNAMFKWKKVYEDIRDEANILLIGEEKTYRLIEDMIRTVSECFTSRRIHLGMDEAYLAGLGKYLQKHGLQDRFGILCGHLQQVCEIAERYGLRPMIWSDMFLKLAAGTDDYYGAADPAVIAERQGLAGKAELVYWDYYSTDPGHYETMIRRHQAFGRPVIFAGGAWTWKGMSPDNGFSMKATAAALRACRTCGVEEILMTVWGDDGAECSCYAVAPALLYAAEAVKGEPDPKQLKKRFSEIMGVSWDDWMLFDRMLMPGVDRHEYDPSKYLLYNDVFTGLLDHRCDPADEEYYADLGRQLKQVSGTGAYGRIFRKYIALCDLLSVKAALGLRTRRAYQAGDTETLRELAEVRYPLAIEKLKAFHKAFQEEWFAENKPFGFDVQDMRLGGAVQRLESCRERLLGCLSGKEEEIPELEEPMLSEDLGTHVWARMVTANN